MLAYPEAPPRTDVNYPTLPGFIKTLSRDKPGLLHGVPPLIQGKTRINQDNTRTDPDDMRNPSISPLHSPPETYGSLLEIKYVEPPQSLFQPQNIFQLFPENIFLSK
jgi:hypothetical protein